MTALLHTLEIAVRGLAVCAVVIAAYWVCVRVFSDDKETK